MQFVGITVKKPLQRFQLMNEICYDKVSASGSLTCERWSGFAKAGYQFLRDFGSLLGSLVVQPGVACTVDCAHATETSISVGECIWVACQLDVRWAMD